MIDVVPTILDCCGIPEPREVNGIPQKPIEGVSMRYTFDDANAKSKRTTQYFEMMVNRAIYNDGWVACSRFGVPWNIAGREGDFLDAPWELYNVEADFSQADDLAATKPDKLKELQAVFLEEAKKYNVFPLDPRMAERLDSRNRVAGEPRTSWTYYGNNVRLPEPIGPLIYPNSHTITAEILRPREGRCEGVIACAGGVSGGWTLLCRRRQACLPLQLRRLRVLRRGRRRRSYPPAKVTVKLEYTSKGTPKGSTISDGATVKLFVNDKLVARRDKQGDVPPRRRAVRGRPRFDLAGQRLLQVKRRLPVHR